MIFFNELILSKKSISILNHVTKLNIVWLKYYTLFRTTLSKAKKFVKKYIFRGFELKKIIKFYKNIFKRSFYQSKSSQKSIPSISFFMLIYYADTFKNSSEIFRLKKYFSAKTEFKLNRA